MGIHLQSCLLGGAPFLPGPLLLGSPLGKWGSGALPGPSLSSPPLGCCVPLPHEVLWSLCRSVPQDPWAPSCSSAQALGDRPGPGGLWEAGLKWRGTPGGQPEPLKGADEGQGMPRGCWSSPSPGVMQGFLGARPLALGWALRTAAGAGDRVAGRWSGWSPPAGTGRSSCLRTGVQQPQGVAQH